MKLFLLFIPILSLAQPDTVSLPMKGRIVLYDTIIPSRKGSIDHVTNLSSKWLSKTFLEKEEPTPTMTVSLGKVDGTGIFKIIINEAGDYYWLKFSIAVRVTDNTCAIQAYDFYEKPTFTGVTNDYSKIEYRWRDFRKGKPWSSGDARLFSGMDKSAKQLIKSYVESMTSGK